MDEKQEAKEQEKNVCVCVESGKGVSGIVERRVAKV